jgi:hypothetical protein
VSRHGKRGRHFGKDLQQRVVGLDEPKVSDTLLSALRHADTPNRRKGSTSLEPARQDRCEAADVKLRPGEILVITERAFPLPVRAYPRQYAVCDCPDQGVLVQWAQRHRCVEDAPEMRLGFGHRRLNGLCSQLQPGTVGALRERLRLVKAGTRTRTARPRQMIWARGAFATRFADGFPASRDPTLIRRRGIAPERLLGHGELAFRNLDELIV